MTSADILQNYDQEDVLVFGDVHTENTHNELEEEAVYRTIPRYVLSEGFDDAEPEEFDEMIDNVKWMSLRDIQTFFEENYDNSQFLADEKREVYEEVREVEPDELPDEISIGKDDGKVPETYNEFMDMPFFRMNGEVKDLIIGSIEDREEYEMQEWDKWMVEEAEEFDQKLEALYGAQSAIRQISSKMPNSKGSLVRPISYLREEGYDVDLAGCDIDKSEEYSDDSKRHFDQPESSSFEELEEQMREREENPEKALEDFAKNLEFISELTSDKEIDRRDQAMAERITHFDQQNDSERPIVAVVGVNHLDGVVQNLQNHDISVYAEDLTDVAEPEDDGFASLVYATETAKQVRKSSVSD